MRYPAFVMATILTVCVGCHEQPHERVVTLPADIVVSKPEFATQRFIPTNSADMAFDTKTGSLCRTWDWQDPGSIPYGKGIATKVSTCNALYDYDVQEQSRQAMLREPNDLGAKSRTH